MGTESDSVSQTSPHRAGKPDSHSSLTKTRGKSRAHTANSCPSTRDAAQKLKVSSGNKYYVDETGFKRAQLKREILENCLYLAYYYANLEV